MSSLKKLPRDRINEVIIFERNTMWPPYSITVNRFLLLALPLNNKSLWGKPINLLCWDPACWQCCDSKHSQEELGEMAKETCSQEQNSKSLSVNVFKTQPCSLETWKLPVGWRGNSDIFQKSWTMFQCHSPKSSHPLPYHVWNELPVQVRCTILDAWGWCTGTTQRDGMGREEGGGFRM